jgi:hypothetical protein
LGLLLRLAEHTFGRACELGHPGGFPDVKGRVVAVQDQLQEASRPWATDGWGASGDVRQDAAAGVIPEGRYRGAGAGRSAVRARVVREPDAQAKSFGRLALRASEGPCTPDEVRSEEQSCEAAADADAAQWALLASERPEPAAKLRQQVQAVLSGQEEAPLALPDVEV